MTRKHGSVCLAAAGALLLPGTAFAEDAVSPGLFAANNAWMMLCAGLVFIMHLGFASVESGLTRTSISPVGRWC